MKNLNRLILIATSFLILSGLYSCDEVTKSYLEEVRLEEKKLKI